MNILKFEVNILRYYAVLIRINLRLTFEINMDFVYSRKVMDVYFQLVNLTLVRYIFFALSIIIYIAAHTQIFEKGIVLRCYFSVILSYQGAHCQKAFVYIKVFETECIFTVLIDLYETYYWKRWISWITVKIFRFCWFKQIFQML